jgi:ribosomal protein L11 methyltransferase
VAALWDRGCLGVQVVASGRPPRLTLDAYYPGQTGAKRLGGRLRLALRQVGLGDQAPLRLGAVRAGRWVETWQKSLRPMAIGRLLVVPEGSRAPARHHRRQAIRVRFGQAFGTGEHATTRLCLRLMGRHLAPGESVADLGTGSGILAMAACRLGAGRVVAVDDDRVALRVARANLRDNGLRRRVDLVCADATSVGALGPFDLVLVNIGAATIERILPVLGGALRAGGRAILAGILVDDERGLVRTAASIGLRPIDRRRSSPWSALVLCRERRPRRMS